MNIPSILEFLYRGITIGPDENYDVTLTDTGGQVGIIWRREEPEPTARDLVAANNDRTTVQGQVYSEWYPENGGDPRRTRKRRAREIIDAIPDEGIELILALAEVLRSELNILRGQHGLSDRTMAQFKTAMLNQLGG